MLRYVKVQSHSSIESVNGKWLIQIKSGEQYDIDALSKHMSEHNSPYSKGVIKGVITDMVNCIKELLLDGKTVKIEDLAIFSLGCHCSPAPDKETLTTDFIRSFTLRARGTGELNAANRASEIKMKECDKYEA